MNTEYSTGTEQIQGAPNPPESYGPFPANLDPKTGKPISRKVDTDKKSLLNDYEHAKATVNFIVGQHVNVVNDVIVLRKLRWQRDLRTENLRAAGVLKEGEGYYPIPVADIKIRKEQPQYLAFLTQSRRAAIFESTDGLSSTDIDLLETDFTNRVHYNEWEIPFIRVIDGMQSQGYDFLELVFDPSKPGHFSFEHVGKEKIAFNPAVVNFQAHEVLPRIVPLSIFQLEQLVKTSGFDPAQVAKCIKYSPENRSILYRLDIISVYKVFFREDDGFVYVGWFHKACDNWLRKPEKLFLGRRDATKPRINSGEVDDIGNPVMVYPPIYETEYPFVLFSYTVTDDPQISLTKGRIELDESAQDAASVLQTSIVNKSYRSSFLTASPAPGPGMTWKSGAPKQLSVPLLDGTIWDSPMNFNYLPAPDVGAMGLVERVLTLSYQGDAQVNYAALNRPDTEKTATEITAANEESSKLSSVQVTLLSIALRVAYTKAFSIYQSRVATGDIVVSNRVRELLVATVPNPLTGGVVIQLKPFTLKSSGDIDVVKKAEMIAKRGQFWPIVLQIIKLGGLFYSNPFAVQYFTDMLKSIFPDDGDKYVKAIMQGAQSGNLLNTMSQLVQQLATDSTTGQLRPELAGQEQAIAGLMQQVQQFTQGSPA